MLDMKSFVVDECHDMLISQQFENTEAPALYCTSVLLALSWNSTLRVVGCKLQYP